MILAGDIGGTYTRVALFEGTPDLLTPVAIQIFTSREHQGLEEIAKRFIAKFDKPPSAACFGVAGAVRDGVVETTNLPWIVSASKVASELGIDRVSLINDLEANAHGIALLEVSDFVPLIDGTAARFGNRALIAAGTGLGEAGLLAELDGSYRPFPSEGGHTDFAPRNELEMELLRYLLGRFDHVSYERVVSGPGLKNIYDFLRDTGRAEEPAWLADALANGDAAATISNSGLQGTSEIGVKALEIFVAVYGAEAGNLALKVVATGGTFIGGGIAPKIVGKLNSPIFAKAFRSKGRASGLMKDIPVRLITNEKTALLGAGRVAALALAAQQG